MKLGILADIHGDLDGLRAALYEFDRLGCDRILCAGDLVGYGPHPDEVVSLVRESGIVCVRGNHDRWAVDGLAGTPAGLRDTADPAKGRLKPETLEFLAGLPFSWHDTIEGVRVAMYHGSPDSDMEGIYAEQVTDKDLRRWFANAKADVLIVGHTHQPGEIALPGWGEVVNPGSVLGPRRSNGPDVRAHREPTSGSYSIIEVQNGHSTSRNMAQ